MQLHMACIKHRSRAAYRTPVVQAGASQLVTGSSIWCSRAGADESVKGCCLAPWEVAWEVGADS